jgi:hypothetical protein
MSQYEHIVGGKGDTLDPNALSKVTEMSRAEEHRACSNNHSYGKAYDQILGIIPFYPGAVGNSSLTGNAHSRSPQEVKTLWLKTVVCSLAQYMGSIVIGVCTNEHKAIADSAVGSMLPFANVSVVVINYHCQLPVYLPFILLRHMKKMLKEVKGHRHHQASKLMNSIRKGTKVPVAQKRNSVSPSRGGSATGGSIPGVDSIQFDDINYGYFTEMDNALHVDNEDTFDSLIEFISTKRGYVSPTRMNKNYNSKPSMISDNTFKVNGQNACNRD